MMVHRKMLALTEGARARITLTVTLGLAISGTFIAQGVVVALVVRRILAGEPWTEALALLGVVALLAGCSFGHPMSKTSTTSAQAPIAFPRSPPDCCGSTLFCCRC